MSGEAPGATEELKRLQEENLYLRAEIENLKKLMAKEVEKVRRESVERVLLDMISIYEEVERAYTSLLGNSDRKQVMEGMKMLLKEMKRILSDNGVDQLETVGKRFDPFIHESVGFVQRDDVEDGTIIAEISRGYAHAGKLLKPPRVIVARRQNP
ncbi:MAG: nucleotide exchange factor GrpE [Nitrososphaerota archaeon]|nr:nucleotide exchange factor GrpE [Candidatus Calditenuaceae archaeon]MDW8073310.1 nucleotide exchange factor GrpE [Nitrososphaerota archaeon]